MSAKLPVIPLVLVSLFLGDSLAHAGQGSSLFRRKTKVVKVLKLLARS